MLFLEVNVDKLKDVVSVSKGAHHHPHSLTLTAAVAAAIVSSPPQLLYVLQAYQVRAMPTFVLVKGGKEVGRAVTLLTTTTNSLMLHGLLLLRSTAWRGSVSLL